MTASGAPPGKAMALADFRRACDAVRAEHWRWFADEERRYLLEGDAARAAEAVAAAHGGDGAARWSAIASALGGPRSGWGAAAVGLFGLGETSAAHTIAVIGECFSEEGRLPVTSLSCPRCGLPWAGYCDIKWTEHEAETEQRGWAPPRTFRCREPLGCALCCPSPRHAPPPFEAELRRHAGAVGDDGWRCACGRSGGGFASRAAARNAHYSHAEEAALEAARAAYPALVAVQEAALRETEAARAGA